MLVIVKEKKKLGKNNWSAIGASTKHTFFMTFEQRLC